MDLPKLPEEVLNTPDYINTENGQKDTYKNLYLDITVPVANKKESEEN